MQKIITHPVVGEVTLSRTRRSVRISLSVRPDGSVRLSFPPWVAQRRALNFLEEKCDWVVVTRQKMAERMAGKMQVGSGAPGMPWPGTPGKSEMRPLQQGFGLDENGRPVDAKKFTETLRAEAKAKLPQMVERLAGQHGFRHGVVRVKATKSRWGSCNGRGDINLSLYLVELPEHLAEYIVLHELCHTVHHNHSARFHALLDKVTDGRHRLLNKELKAFRPGM